MQIELSEFAQNSEESQVFLHEKSVSLKKDLWKLVLGQNYWATPIDC